ncbi:glycosyltransferase family 2 protein [Shinella daejeonensis]|uniref:glycosyltransferase family 2 protein n=1 Tax=Shinella daejeonensis TaxID=659017 RepID=UPI0020C7CB9C|nr:glycosyltransferase family 2 protein [Shinella daejeonensis]MCP8896335.1 glycosyltransferase family 2 protein [Shinella daejeonensis]
MKLLKKISKEISDFYLYFRLFLEDRLAGRSLTLVQDRLGAIRKRDILLVSCLRNERFRMPAFVDYYRKLGVSHFLFVDNDSTDGFMDWAGTQEDVTVWHTAASYRDAKFGMLWLNDILRRHCRGHWCVVVDPDEFLVYPYMETRSLAALTQFLDEEKRPCMHTLMLDAYGKGPLEESLLAEGQDPFEVCPYFDKDGYLQVPSWGHSTWIRGGPRLRVHFAENPDEAPALNKVPLIKWRFHYHYNMSMHDARPFYLNRAHRIGNVSTSGVLFHFKMVSSLIAKAEEESQRKEHYADGREYDRYLAAEQVSFYEPGISCRYERPGQLVALGLMSPGQWF